MIATVKLIHVPILSLGTFSLLLFRILKIYLFYFMCMSALLYECVYECMSIYYIYASHLQRMGSTLDSLELKL